MQHGQEITVVDWTMKYYVLQLTLIRFGGVSGGLVQGPGEWLGGLHIPSTILGGCPLAILRFIELLSHDPGIPWDSPGTFSSHLVMNLDI